MWLAIANQENHIVLLAFCQYYFCRSCNSSVQFSTQQGSTSLRNFIATFVGCALPNEKCPASFSASHFPAVLQSSMRCLAFSSGRLHMLSLRNLSCFCHCPAPSRGSPLYPQLLAAPIALLAASLLSAHKKTQPRGTAFSFVSLICRAKICRSFPSAAPGPSGPTASAPDPPKSRLRGASPSYSARSPGCTARCSSYAP